MRQGKADFCTPNLCRLGGMNLSCMVYHLIQRCGVWFLEKAEAALCFKFLPEVTTKGVSRSTIHDDDHNRIMTQET